MLLVTAGEGLSKRSTSNYRSVLQTRVDRFTIEARSGNTQLTEKGSLEFFFVLFFLERWRCESLFNILHNNKPIYFSSALVFSVDAVQKKVHWNFQKKEKKTVKVKLQQLLCHLRRETLNMAWTSNNYKYVQSLMKWSGLSHPQQRISFRPVISEYHSVGKKQE